MKASCRRRAMASWRWRAVLLACCFAAASGTATAMQVLKQADGEGRVTYSDQLLPGKRVVRTLEMPQASEMEREEIEARRLAIAREIRMGASMLAEAQRALDNGLAPQAGERNGRRLNEAYFNRIAGLEQRIVDARVKLERAYMERNRIK